MSFKPLKVETNAIERIMEDKVWLPRRRRDESHQFGPVSLLYVERRSYEGAVVFIHVKSIALLSQMGHIQLKRSSSVCAPWMSLRRDTVRLWSLKFKAEGRVLASAVLVTLQTRHSREAFDLAPTTVNDSLHTSRR